MIVVCDHERCTLTGTVHLVVSHGFDTLTGQLAALPRTEPEAIGARSDAGRREFVLDPDRS